LHTTTKSFVTEAKPLTSFTEPVPPASMVINV